MILELAQSVSIGGGIAVAALVGHWAGLWKALAKKANGADDSHSGRLADLEKQVGNDLQHDIRDIKRDIEDLQARMREVEKKVAVIEEKV